MNSGELIESKKITLNNLTLHYTQTGQGPPALLVHGYAHAWTMWERPLRYLSHRYCCYAIDLPGHGHSDKPPLGWYTLDNFCEILCAFCRQLELDHLLYLGYSMGGLMGMQLALTQPHLIGNLITINSPVKGDFLSWLDPLLRLEPLIRRPWAEKLFRLYLKLRVIAIPVELRRYAHPKMLLSSSCRRVQREMAQCTLQTLFGDYKVVRQADLSDQVAQLAVPLLAITTDRDRVVPPQQPQFVHEQVKQSQFVTIPECGHLPIDEQPEQFDEVLKAYLNLNPPKF